MPVASAPKTPSYFSESLARGLAVLRVFDRKAPRLRVSDVAERAGLNRAATRRYLLTLRDLGYVALEGDHFVLRPRVLDLGYSYFAAADIGTTIQPLLVELAERTQDATSFGVRDGHEVLIVARASKRTLDLNIGPGTRLPLLQTALGRILVAGLQPTDFASVLSALQTDAETAASIGRAANHTRRQGYAVVQGELAPKLVGIAVPICDRGGQTIAALNVTSYTTQRQALISDVLPLIKATKVQIEAALRLANTATLINPKQSEAED